MDDKVRGGAEQRPFAERFHLTARDGFFRVAFRTAFHDSVDTLQADFDSWLVHYNAEWPHLGYRDRGKRPRHTVDEYFTSLRQ
jgi:hypothetical protein